MHVRAASTSLKRGVRGPTISDLISVRRPPVMESFVGDTSLHRDICERPVVVNDIYDDGTLHVARDVYGVRRPHAMSTYLAVQAMG